MIALLYGYIFLKSALMSINQYDVAKYLITLPTVVVTGVVVLDVSYGVVESSSK